MKFLSRYWPSMITLILLLCFMVTWYPRHVPNNPFINDDADYAFAAKKGIFANAWDVNALSWETFLNMGLGKGMEKEQYTSLSNFVRSSGSIPFYRHYHGPLYSYGLAAAMSISSDEKWLRLSGLFWLLFMAGVASWSLCILYPNLNIWPPVLAAGLIGLSHTGYTSATLLTGHVTFACFSIISLSAAGKWLAENNRRWLVCSGMAGGVAFATVEYAIIIPFSILVATCLHRRLDTGLGWKSIAIDAGVWTANSVVILFLVWPAGILKLTIVKNYIFLAYFLFVRSEAFLKGGIISAWLSRISSDPIIYGVMLTGILWSVRLLFNEVKLKPMLIFSLLFFLSTIRNSSLTPTYVIAFLGISTCLSVLGMGLRAEKFGFNFKLIALPVLFLGIFTLFLRDYTPDETSGQNWVFWPSVSEGLRYKAVVNGIADYQKKHGPILIDRSLAPSLKYYYPEQSFDTYMYKEGENEEVFEMFGTGRYSGLYFPKIENFSSKFEVYGDNYRLEKTDLQGLYLINYLNR